MSNLLKSKLVIILGSVVILILIPAFKSNFNAPVTFNEWKQLNWNDFQGFAKPFTGWDAGISSNVYVDYDSTEHEYRAYAAMNNQLSWKKSSSTESDYLLNHEQYHFNITEYHARLMNEYLIENGGKSESEISQHLSTIRNNLDEMQNLYDAESDHGLNQDLQRWWEFKIDSLLNQDGGQKISIDYLSGASVYFPVNPIFDQGVNDNNSYRYFLLEKYDMTLGISSFQYENDIDWSREDAVHYYESDSVLVLEFNFDSLSTSDITCNVKSRDTISNEVYFHKWVFNGDYLYKVTATYPDNSGSNAGYDRIASTFLESFEIQNVSEYWIHSFESSDSEIILTSTLPRKKEEDKGVTTKCLANSNNAKHGFYGKPFFDEYGSLFVPYSIIRHPDSLINEVVAIYEDGWYSYEVESGNQIIFIPSDNIPSDLSTINFGYLLKEDTVEECFRYYYETVQINRQITDDKLNEQTEL